ncbi:MAG TPA: SDR family NAD(P)-dependent oxidoreductase [Candidatus Competibacter sp.]|nr:SDR family NAD(P)-dependent oxidoreductase [Candidatus Competibacter sp.]
MNPKITDWGGRRVWLIGASSGIGAALATELAGRGAKLGLSARRTEMLATLGPADALRLPCDATDVARLAAARAELLAAWQGIDLVIYLAGDYAPMRAENFDLTAAEKLFAVNYLGALRATATVLPDLTAGGGIAFVASVAGYGGLPKALAYGPGKAALIHFAECLYFDLSAKGVGVWVVNPGFVATPLTARNDFKMPVLLTPEQAARALADGFGTGGFEIHFPKRFTRWLKLASLLPYRWYFPLVRSISGG